MPEFHDNLEKIVHEIEAHPDLEVVDYSVQPPITKEAKRSVETALGSPVPDELSEFYGRANGIRLHWRVREDTDPDRLEELRARSDEYWIEVPENEENPFARINILPLELAVVGIDWIDEYAFPSDPSRTIEIGGESYKEIDVAQRLKPFDLYEDYSCMAYLFNAKGGPPGVLWLTNQYHDWSHSRITDFPSYLEFLIACRGICDAREDAYSTASGGGKDWKAPGIFNNT